MNYNRSYDKWWKYGNKEKQESGFAIVKRAQLEQLKQ